MATLALLEAMGRSTSRSSRSCGRASSNDPPVPSRDPHERTAAASPAATRRWPCASCAVDADGGSPSARTRRPPRSVEIALVSPCARRRAARARRHGDRARRRGRSHEVRRRVPRRRARPGARRRDPRRGRAGPPLQAHGGVRRPHALDLQVRHRRPAARERRARPRARLPRVRDPDGPRGRRHRDRPPARRDLHLLRRHDARPRLGRLAAGREGGGRRRADGLLAARRAADRQGQPRPRRRLLRDRVRDHGALDGADAEARAGGGRDQLPLHVQPRDDRAAAAGAARLARPAPRRLHRPRPRLHRRRRAAVRVHPGATTASRSSSRASSRSTCCRRCT